MVHRYRFPLVTKKLVMFFIKGKRLVLHDKFITSLIFCLDKYRKKILYKIIYLLLYINKLRETKRS